MERKPYWTGSYNHPLPPFSRSLRCAPTRAGLPSATKIDRFATLSWWANRSYFSFGSVKGTLSAVNPWRGRDTPEDAAGSIPPKPIPLGHRAGGSKGAEVKAERFYFSPLRRRSRLLRSLEPGGSWRIFGDFLFARKSPGCRAERLHWWV